MKYLLFAIIFSLPFSTLAQQGEPLVGYYKGETVYPVSYDSGILDVMKNSGKVFSFRQVVDINKIICSEKMQRLATIDYETDTDFVGEKIGNENIIICVVDGDSRTDATWISYIEINSSEYFLGNGIRVGMPVEEFIKVTGVNDAGSKIYLRLIVDVYLPAKYHYRVNGHSDDTLDTFIEVQKSDGVISKIRMLVWNGNFLP